MFKEPTLEPKNDETLKTVSFWTDKIEKAGLTEKLAFFNDIVTEKRTPDPKAGYGEPVLRDVILDGQLCDVYHTDHNDGDTWHRLFIYIKNQN